MILIDKIFEHLDRIQVDKEALNGLSHALIEVVEHEVHTGLSDACVHFL